MIGFEIKVNNLNTDLPPAPLPSESLRYIRTVHSCLKTPHAGLPDFLEFIRAVRAKNDYVTLLNSLSVLTEFGDMSAAFPILVGLEDSESDKDPQALHLEHSSAGNFFLALIDSYILDGATEQCSKDVVALLIKLLTRGNVSTAAAGAKKLFDASRRYQHLRSSTLAALAATGQHISTVQILGSLLDRPGQLEIQDRFRLLIDHFNEVSKHEGQQWSKGFVDLIIETEPALTQLHTASLQTQMQEELALASVDAMCSPMFAKFPMLFSTCEASLDTQRSPSIAATATERIGELFEFYADKPTEIEKLNAAMNALRGAGIALKPMAASETSRAKTEDENVVGTLT